MFSTVESNMRKTWKLINQTMGKKPKQSKIDKPVVNNQSITDNNKLANEFNEFFVNIGPSLSNEIKKNIPNMIKVVIICDI